MRAALANDIRNLVEQRGCHGCSVLCPFDYWDTISRFGQIAAGL
jgi:hypothetical protein